MGDATNPDLVDGLACACCQPEARSIGLSWWDCRGGYLFHRSRLHLHSVTTYTLSLPYSQPFQLVLSHIVLHRHLYLPNCSSSTRTNHEDQLRDL